MKNLNRFLLLTVIGLLAFTGFYCGDDDDDSTGPDPVAPFVSGLTPADGATEVSVSAAVVVYFSKSMDTSVGTVDITNGGADVAATGAWAEGYQGANSKYTITPDSGTWPFGATLTINVRNDFKDTEGNGLVEAVNAYFTVETDTGSAAPFVTYASPTDDATDVDTKLSKVIISFSQEMNPATGTATLSPDGGFLSAGTWISATTVEYSISDEFQLDTAYTITLADFQNSDGTAADYTSGVVSSDGVLNFATVAVATQPVVSSSIPAEGATDVSPNNIYFQFVFSKAMDTTIGNLIVMGSAPHVVNTMEWSPDGTTLTCEILNGAGEGGLELLQDYTVFFLGFTDAAGNDLDINNAYLVDGALNFTTGDYSAQPTGDDCANMLTEAHAGLAGDYKFWKIIGSNIITDEGFHFCDLSTTSDGDDGVIEFTKTSAEGVPMEIRTINRSDDDGSQLNLTILENCADFPAVEPGTCKWARDNQLIYFDGAPGTYYLWFGSGTTAAHDDIEVYMQDNAVPAIGELCDNPLTEADATVAGSLYTWNVTEKEFTSHNATGLSFGPGNNSCEIANDTYQTAGPDFYILYNKVSDVYSVSNQVLRIKVTNDSTDDLSMEAMDGCDLTTATSYGCIYDNEEPYLELDIPAGPVYIMLNTEATSDEFGNMTIEIDEFTPPCVPGAGGMVGTTETRYPSGITAFFTEYYVEADESPTGYVYVGGSSALYRLAKDGTGTYEDVELDAGLTSSHLGYDMIINGNDLFTLDSATAADRFYRISSDGGATWLATPESWASFGSTADDFRAVAYWNNSFYFVTHSTTNAEVWSIDATTQGSTPVLEATVIDSDTFTGISVDDDYFYLGSSDFTTEAIYRYLRADGATPTGTAISTITDLSSSQSAMHGVDVDTDGIIDHLYIGSWQEEVYAICDPDSAPYEFILSTLVGKNYGMDYDPSLGVLWVYDDDDDEFIKVE